MDHSPIQDQAMHAFSAVQTACAHQGSACEQAGAGKTGVDRANGPAHPRQCMRCMRKPWKGPAVFLCHSAHATWRVPKPWREGFPLNPCRSAKEPPKCCILLCWLGPVVTEPSFRNEHDHLTGSVGKPWASQLFHECPREACGPIKSIDLLKPVASFDIGPFAWLV